MELAAATLSYSNLISVIGAILAAVATIDLDGLEFDTFPQRGGQALLSPKYHHHFVRKAPEVLH